MIATENHDNDDSFFPMVCKFCDKSFGKDVVKLAVHISRTHARQEDKLFAITITITPLLTLLLS